METVVAVVGTTVVETVVVVGTGTACWVEFTKVVWVLFSKEVCLSV